MRNIVSGLVAIGIVSFSVAAWAADPALVCQAGKLKEAGKYGACRLAAESRAARLGALPVFTNCTTRFSLKWQGAETKAGVGVCPSEYDEVAIDERIAGHTDAIAVLLAGGAVAECGDGIVNGAEQCDGSDLAGQTCASLGYTIGGTLACAVGCGFETSGCVSQRLPASGQTTSYGIGDDGDVESGATLAYVDSGDGTITDSNTGLMWEKKVGLGGGYANCTTEAGSCANPHNANNRYAWSVGAPFYNLYDGSVVTIFLEQLNNRCNNNTMVTCSVDADCTVPGGACGFAGHRDWRLPNVRELASIVDYSKASPVPTVTWVFNGENCGSGCTDIHDPGCSCTASSWYWSATTLVDVSEAAWFVDFDLSRVEPTYKENNWFVRAVRGGS